MMEVEVIHSKQEPFYYDQQSDEYESYENVKEENSVDDNSDWKDSEITIDRLSYGYEASLEETPDFSQKSLTSDWSYIENEFFQDGWLSQFFFETCCESCCFPVRRIDLSYRKIQEKIGRKLINTDIPPLLVFLGNNPDVITVNLGYNDIDDSGFINFIEHAAVHQNIFGLNMSYNNVTQRGMKHMLLYVKSLNIKSLQLKGNNLNNEGLVLLSEFLKRNHHIVELDVANVGQTVQSLSQLINVLNPIYESCNTSLKILDISRPTPPTRYYVFNGDVVADWIGRLLEVITMYTKRRKIALLLDIFLLSAYKILNKIRDITISEAYIV